MTLLSALLGRHEKENFHVTSFACRNKKSAFILLEFAEMKRVDLSIAECRGLSRD